MYLGWPEDVVALAVFLGYVAVSRDGSSDRAQGIAAAADLQRGLATSY
jgi:hypothetical protein